MKTNRYYDKEVLNKAMYGLPSIDGWHVAIYDEASPYGFRVEEISYSQDHIEAERKAIAEEMGINPDDIITWV